MSITEPPKKINIFVSIVVAILLTLIAACLYGIFILKSRAEGRKEPYIFTSSAYGSRLSNTSLTSEVVGSKNGNVYHLPWCSGAKRIKPENLVTFKSREEAEKKGYRSAANCTDLNL